MSAHTPTDSSSLATDLQVLATYRLSEALADSDRRMRRRVDLLSEVVFETDADGRLVFLNRAWLSATGREPAASLGSHLRDFVVADDWPICEAALSGSSLDTADDHTLFRMIRADGSFSWMEISIAQIEGDGAVGAMRDVTQQKVAKDELAKVSLVASFTDNLVVITDREGRTEWVNQAFMDKTGYRLDELVDRKPGDILQGPGTDRTAIDQIAGKLREGKSFSAELLNYTKRGESYWVRVHVSPIRKENGEIERFVSIQTDSTELRRTQQELEGAMLRAESANAAKTLFLATISHEMRTPLNVILGSTELALDRNVDNSGIQADLSRIRDSGEALLHLITDLLDLSKVEAGQLDARSVPVDIRACLSGAIAHIADAAHAKGLELSCTLGDSLPNFMLGDPDRLRQIITNLVENAVKFTEQGFVRVEATAVSAQGAPQLQIRVRDSGIGIEAGSQSRIFERFVQLDSSTTRRKGGAGLGLSIVRSLVTALGGSVSVASDAGHGSVFLVTLPLAAAAAPVTIPHLTPLTVVHRSADVPVSAARILVAEDNDANFAVIEAYLTRSGYVVERAMDGREAIAAAPRNDLILMDVEMPELDGLDATRQIRALESIRGETSVPVIALTAHALQEYRDRCLAAGCSGYLSKPVRMQALLDAVAGALRPTAEAAPNGAQASVAGQRPRRRILSRSP